MLRMQEPNQGLNAVSEFLRSLSDRDVGRFLTLWMDDGCWEFPFGAGLRSVQGKDAIEAFLSRFFETFRRVAFENIRIFQTVEPNVLFSEYEGDMDVRSTGRPYRNTYIAKVRLDGDKIVSIREYFNPTVVAEAMAPK